MTAPTRGASTSGASTSGASTSGASTSGASTSREGPAPSRARALVARATSLEGAIYSSIARAIARRPAVSDGAKGFGYHSSSMTLLIVFIVLSTVEIFVVDLIVHRWLPVRIALLVVGIWGVVWMTGLLCAHLMRPHEVGPDGIRVRDGLDLDAQITWDDVRSVAITRVSDAPKSPRIVDSENGRILAIRIFDATNIEIVLEGPTVLKLPGLPPKGGHQLISTVRLWADDPRGFLDEVGAHI